MSMFYVKSKKIIQVCDRIVSIWIRFNTSQRNEQKTICFSPLPSNPYLFII